MPPKELVGALNAIAGTTGKEAAGAANAILAGLSGLGQTALMAGDIGDIPAAGLAGRFYFAEDEGGGTLYRDSGVAWVQVAPGVESGAEVELGYQERLTDFSTTSSSFTAITSLSVDATVGVRPIKIEFDATVENSAIAICAIQFMEDGVSLGTRAWSVPVAAGQYPLYVKRRSAPAAGLHTYTVEVLTTAGTLAVRGATSGRAPMALQVLQV